MVRAVQNNAHLCLTPNTHSSKHSYALDLVIAIATSAIALFVAKAYRHSNPALSNAFNCIPIGVGVICFFKFFVFNRNHSSHHSYSSSSHSVDTYTPYVNLDNSSSSPWFHGSSPQTRVNYSAGDGPQTRVNYSIGN